MNARVNGRQAIVTKYLGATGSRGSRIKASAEAGTITIAWDHSLNTGDNHAAAAQALITKLGWASGGEFLGSALPNGKGYAFVEVNGAVAKLSVSSDLRGALVRS